MSVKHGIIVYIENIRAVAIKMIVIKKYIAVATSIIILFGFALPCLSAFENIHVNTGSGPDDIVAVATSQLGYMEGDISGKIKGNNDCTKFGQWYGMNYVPWCAIFVSWCANQAAIPTSVIPKHASCDLGVEWFKKHGNWQDSKYYGGKYTPRKGDIIYFGKRTSKIFDSTHVGIVTSVSGSTIYTIEGNCGAMVQKQSYKLTSAYILGYGVPNYNNTITAYNPGEYTVSADALNVRAGPSTSYDILFTIRKGTSVSITDVSGKWGKIAIMGTVGWISMEYLDASVIVFLDANGGSMPQTKLQKSPNNGVNIPKTIPTRTEYKFIGWGDSPESYYPLYQPGDRIVSNASSTIYALWEPNNSNIAIDASEGGFSIVTEYNDTRRVFLCSSDDNAISYLALDGKQQLLLGDMKATTMEFNDTLSHSIEVKYTDNSLIWINCFDDVPDNIWYNKAVGYCINKRYFTGVSSTKFSPLSNITRENAIVVLGKVYEARSGKTIEDIPNIRFKDVISGSYYEKYVVWGLNNGITSGINYESFGVGNNITRAQISLMLKNLATILDDDTNYDSDLLNDVVDADASGAWAFPALCWAIGKDIISKNGDMISPSSFATRAQIAQMIYKLYHR